MMTQNKHKALKSNHLLRQEKKEGERSFYYKIQKQKH